MQVKFISTIQPIQMTPTKIINSISLSMQVIRVIQESIISNATSTSTRAIYLCFPSIFLGMLPCNHLNFSTFKFHVKFKKSRSNARGITQYPIQMAPTNYFCLHAMCPHHSPLSVPLTFNYFINYKKMSMSSLQYAILLIFN